MPIQRFVLFDQFGSHTSSTQIPLVEARIAASRDESSATPANPRIVIVISRASWQQTVLEILKVGLRGDS
jgi:hypothetical protein